MKQLLLCLMVASIALPLSAQERRERARNPELMELREKAEHIEAELREARERGAEREVAELKKHLLQVIKTIKQREIQTRRQETHKDQAMDKLSRIVREIAELRMQSIRAKREGRIDQARELWLKADHLDKLMHEKLHEGAKEKAPRHPAAPFIEGSIKKINHLFEKAHQMWEKDLAHDAEKCYWNILEILAHMSREFDGGPGPDGVVVDQAHRLFEGVEALHRAEMREPAEKLKRELTQLMQRMTRGREQPGKPSPDKLHELRRRAEELAAAREEIEMHINELREHGEKTGRALNKVKREWAERERECPEEVKQEIRNLGNRMREIERKAVDLKAKEHEIDREREEIARNIHRWEVHQREREQDRHAEAEEQEHAEHREAEEQEHAERREAEEREHAERREVEEREHAERREAEERERDEQRETEERERDEQEVHEQHEKEELWREIDELRAEIRELRQLLKKALEAR